MGLRSSLPTPVLLSGLGSLGLHPWSLCEATPPRAADLALPNTDPDLSSADPPDFWEPNLFPTTGDLSLRRRMGDLSLVLAGDLN